jgi:hypothetical protein
MKSGPLTAVGFSFHVLLGSAGYLVYSVKGAMIALLVWSATRVFIIGDRLDSQV